MSNWYEQGGAEFKPFEVSKRQKRQKQTQKAAKMSAVRHRFKALQSLYKELFPEEEWSWELINVERKMTTEMLKRGRNE